MNATVALLRAMATGSDYKDRKHDIILNAGANEIERLRAINAELLAALRLFRSIVREGGVPRYTITSGAALNSVIEEVIDPVLAKAKETT